MVGTGVARWAIESLRIPAQGHVQYTRAADQRAPGRDASILLDLLAHRDHLAAQVTELQVSNTALLERAHAAESAAAHARAELAAEEDRAAGVYAGRETLRGRALDAEADALKLADLVDEFDDEEFVFLGDETRALVARLMTEGGLTPRRPGKGET